MLHNFLEYVVSRLVEYPEDISIEMFEDGDTDVYELTLRQSDLGKVVGRQGKTVNSIRSLIQLGMEDSGRKCALKLIED
jgi:predicted RNA-binding protein YlqC (UPF0109 family)